MLRPRRLLWRAFQALVALVSLSVAVVSVAGYPSFGARARGERRARMERSPNWREGRFVNPQPLVNSGWLALTGAFHVSPHGQPRTPMAVMRDERGRFDTP